MPYNMKVIKRMIPMYKNTEELVEGVVIDVCTRSFLLISTEGNERFIQCDSPEEFMNILAVCDAKLNEDQIEYAELAIA